MALSVVPPAEPADAPPPPRLSVAARLRNYLLAGILVTAPISITFYLTWSVVTWVDDAVARVLPIPMPGNVPGFGLIILAAALVFVGFITANFLGRALIGLGERILARTPIIRGVYGSVKQVFETVFKDQSGAFREVVLVEFPRVGSWTMALVAGRPDGELKDKLPEDMVTVYIPTSPNPTSGYILFVPRIDTIRVDMTVDECLRMVLSGGLAVPSRPRGV